MASTEKIAKILKCDIHLLVKINERMGAITNKRHVFEKIEEENERRIKDSLLTLGVAYEAGAKEIYDALISKIESDDYKIFKAFQEPDIQKREDCDRILEMAKKIVAPQKGFFLKKEKAIEFLQKEPPLKILEYLKYDSVDKMLEHEDLFEVYCALRFIEGSEWLNSTFFKQYESLTPDDFEERDIIVRTISARWDSAAQAFIKKKKHNISHLKELGIVFVIPAMLGISGELLRMLSLVFHYLHEVPFYSDMFRRSAAASETFAQSITSLLRGDVIEHHLAEGDKIIWLVIQRYLAKDDENDWRLSYPHINPEALHWVHAEEDLIKLGTSMNHFGADLRFWSDLDWVGDTFKDDVGNDVLISFDLVDTVMSLVKEKEMVKYLYHHQEALWNKIFESYYSKEELEAYSKQYLLKGYFEI